VQPIRGDRGNVLTVDDAVGIYVARVRTGERGVEAI